ncbi:hypothetical protein ACHQM5_024625 [Ranunculus cassubicifolius]
MASETNRPRRTIRVNNQQLIQDQPRAKWTLYLTKTLADLMVEQVYRGERHNCSFSKKAWEYMCIEFQKKTGLNWDKEQLKNRYGVMRKQHATVKSLLDLKDFSWDENLSLVMGSDQVWDKYIKAHPDADAIRSNGCPYYKQLCIIFGENTNMDLLLESPNTAALMPLLGHDESASSSDEEEEDDEIEQVKKSQTKAVPSSRGSKRNHPSTQDVMARAILDIAEASKLRTSAMAAQRFSVSNCVEALDELEGVDQAIYYVALDLFDNRNARETFLSLKVERRLGWLKTKCNTILNYTLP